MSVVWCLPRDILHSIYSEWLEWKDRSSLDIACVGKRVREAWLTSLTDLRIFEFLWIVSNGKLKIFYQWLLFRKVFFVEDFPIKLNVPEDLAALLGMESYCPVLRSIMIDRSCTDEYASDDSYVKSNLSVFLSHCHNLQGVTVFMNNSNRDVVLSALIEILKENSLVKITIHIIQPNEEIKMKVRDFVAKHASSLRGLCISKDFIVLSTLIKNQICLREMSISLGYEPLLVLPSLISYLSSSGGMLEDLEVSGEDKSFNAEDLVVSVAASCPKLTRLATVQCKPCSIETLRRLYEQCPHLQDVFIGSLGSVDRIIETEERRNSVSIKVEGHSEDWAICLSHALRRGHYKKVSLRLRDDYNHPVGNLKSLLEPYEIHLQTLALESSLISLLQDLPHLNSLLLLSKVDNRYTDATLAAITEHVDSLMELSLRDTHFSDKLLSELIKACELLERLIIRDCGWETLGAISQLSNLNMVDLTMARSVSEEMLDALLLNEKVTWSSTLKKGSIRASGWSIPYEFNNEYHQWIR
eukprot:scaffold233_cov174-Ochromonas_danica.AAC.18